MSMDLTTSGGWANSNLVDNIDMRTTTMAAWIYYIGGGDPAGVVFSTATAILGGHSSYRITAGDDVNVKIGFVVPQWTSAGAWSLDETITAGAWRQIGITYDMGATANDPIMYLDGVAGAISEGREPGGSASDDVIKAVSFALGQGGLPETQLEYMHIAEAALWNGILSADEMRALAYLPPCAVRPFDLRVYWPMWSHEFPTATSSPRELIQSVNMSVVGATPTTSHPPITTYSNRLWGRGVPFVGRTQAVGRLVNREARLMALSGRLVT